MKVDNARRAGKIKLLYLAVPFIVVVAIALIYLVYDTKEFIWAVYAGLILLFFFSAMFFFRLYYITFYAGPDKIRLRYKSLSPFPTQNNSIQIDSGKLHDYKITNSFFGNRKHIVFYVNTPGGVAAYPRTSISALNNSEVEQITKALELIKKLNNSSK